MVDLELGTEYDDMDIILNITIFFFYRTLKNGLFPQGYPYEPELCDA